MDRLNLRLTGELVSRYRGRLSVQRGIAHGFELPRHAAVVRDQTRSVQREMGVVTDS